MALFGTGARASEGTAVSVKVRDDGESCLVQGRTTRCEVLPSFLAHDLATARDSEVTVSPVGCGEAALARARAVASTLTKAGFTKVFVVGFLTEPGGKCTA